MLQKGRQMSRVKKIMRCVLAAVLVFAAVLQPQAVVRAEEAEAEDGLLHEDGYTYQILMNGSAAIVSWEGEDEEVKIPTELGGHEVTMILKGAFSGQTMRSVELPDGLTQIGANPFAYCTELAEFRISPYHENFAVIDGVLFEKSSRRLISYPQAREPDAYTVPEGIAEVSAYAFAGSGLLEITLPQTLQSIGDLAFVNCKALTEVSIPESVLLIGANPFACCSSLVRVTVPEGHPSCRLIGAFLTDNEGKKVISFLEPVFKLYSVSELITPQMNVTVPQGITGIGDYAFMESSVEEVVLPEGLTFIGEGAFGSCTALQNISLPASAAVYGDFAFADCSSLKEIVFPEDTTAIGKECFSGCFALEKAVLSAKIREIGDHAFDGCRNLVVTVPSQYAKRYCDRFGLDYVYADEGSLDWLTEGIPSKVPGEAQNGHVVCIDAGHQQHGISEQEPNGPGSAVMKAKLTTGTQGIATGLTEYQLNLDVSLKLRDELEARGYNVVMIRETNDCPLSNAERAEVANNSGSEIFVRIHANSSDSQEVRGAMFYAPSPANPYMQQEIIAASNALSNTMLNVYCARTGIQNMGLIQDDSMTGINWCRVPVTIVEMGFMSNPDEDRLMADPEFQKVIAAGLADGIDAYFGMNPVK